MLRRTVAIAAGLALTASVGLVGAGAASAVSPAMHIKPGAQWTAEVNGSGCEVETFSANNTFTGDMDGDYGSWSGSGPSISMVWSGRGADPLTFVGTFTKTPVKEYAGRFNGSQPNSYSGQLVEGAVSTFHGFPC